MAFPLFCCRRTFDASGAALAIFFGLVARMERSVIRAFTARMLSPDYAALHPGYKVGVRQKSNLLKRINVIWVVYSYTTRAAAGASAPGIPHAL
jgi:hypothetical protein